MRRVVVVLALMMILVAAAAFAGGAKEAPKEMVKMTWISPRGTLAVMDDYNMWVPIQLGYFKEMGLDVDMEPGPMDSFAATKFVDQGKADVGYPSPGILTSSVDSGMNVIMVYEMMMGQVFDFAVKKDSPIKSLADFPGHTMSIGDAGWQVIVDPILVEAGIDPKSITYVTAGAQWGQAVSLGKADIALTWEGLRAQWEAQGLDLRYFIGQDFSKMPANGYCARKTDLKDPTKRDHLVKLLRGASMGIYFAHINPRAAAQITYDRFPELRQQMTPDLALKSMQQLHWGYMQGELKGQGFGWFNLDSWKTYLGIIYKLGQTKKDLTVGEVATNELIKEANNFDKARVEKDAKAFKLNDTWKNVQVTGDW
jgi:NitT/TauT family transport system substrate-binding protein